MEETRLKQENERLKTAIAELSVLNDIATTITSTQPVDQIVASIVNKCVKHMKVEQGVVMLLDEQDKNNPLHTMIRKQDSGEKLLSYQLDSQLTGWMIKNKKPLLINNLQDDQRFKYTVENDSPIYSLLSVPLNIKNKMIGLLAVFNKKANELFNENDKRLLAIIASQSAQIIENSRLIKQESQLRLMNEDMRLAKETQLNLLPKNLPLINNYQIGAKSIPAKQVGGDYYDVMQVDDSKFAFCLGDVSGKGLPAAILVSNLQATLRSQTFTCDSCKQIIANSNNLLYRSSEPSKFATLFYGILNSGSHEIVFCNAGHNNPLLFSYEKELLELKTGGIMIGSFPDLLFEESKIIIEKGSTIVIYSDGISEAMNENEEEYGEDNLKITVLNNLNKSPNSIIENILSDVEKFVGGAPQSDDMTLVVIKRTD